MARAILPCMQSVDLNSIRAGLAMTLEGSDLSSVQDRIEDLKQVKKPCADTSAQCAENAVKSVPCSEPAVSSAAFAMTAGSEKAIRAKIFNICMEVLAVQFFCRRLADE